MNRQWLEPNPNEFHSDQTSDAPTTSPKEIFAVIRRRIGLIASIVILCIVAAGIYVFTAKPIYEASAVILIDRGESPVLTGAVSESRFFRDNLVVESEIEVIKSKELLKRVAKNISVYSPPESSTPKLLSPVKEWINDQLGIIYEKLGIVEDVKESEGKSSANRGFLGEIKVRRIGPTSAIRINYESTGPERAAEIPNAVAQAYLDDKLEARFAASKRTNDWLRKRIAVLQKEVIAADRSVELYKAEHNIVNVKSGLVSDQQLSELNSQLIIARSKTAQTRARYDRIKFIVRENNANAALEDVLSSGAINDLRKKYAAVRSRAQELKSKYGSTHLAYLNFKGAVDRIRALILEELKRIEQSYESSYEIAKARQISFEKELERLKGEHVFSSQNQIRLRDFERQAEAKRDLYKSLLETFQKSNTRESLPSVYARVIEFAEVPDDPVKPNKIRTLLLALVFGIASGTGLAFLRESLDNLVWTPGDLEKLFTGNNLGLVPEMNIKLPRLKSQRKRKRKREIFRTDEDDEGCKQQLLEPAYVSPFRVPLVDQFSHVSEVMRNILVSFRLIAKTNSHKGAQVLTFISTMPGEGKSTISMLQALYQAGQGSRTLLIDSDIRKPFLTRSLTPEAERGICDLAIDDNPDLKRYIWHDEETGLDFLPALSSGGSIANADFFIRGDISEIIDRFREEYDYIIIDLPPILVLPDARILADTIDHIIYVVEWGKVHKESIAEAMKSSPELARLIIGSVLNKVNVKKVKRYGGYYYGSQYYYS